MQAVIKLWCGRLESVKVDDSSGLFIFIGSEFTQAGSQLQLPGEPTTKSIRHEVVGDEIHLISKSGAYMGGGVLSSDERRASQSEWVSFKSPLGTLRIPGLQAAIEAGKATVLDASFEAA
jgi:hypothetical protein